MPRLLLYTFFLCSLGSLTSNSKIDFHFTDEPIDVVIPCVEKDLPILELCIAGIKKNCKNLRRVIVVSKNHLTDNAEWFNEANYPFSLKDVQNALICNDPLRASKLIKKNRTGWYFQQLLKLYACIVIPDISSNTLVLDADTVFLRPTSFLNDLGGGVYGQEHNHHGPYFTHAQKLIPSFQLYTPGKSGICHHMLYQRPILKVLFNEIEATHGVPAWTAYCNLVDSKEISGSGFSEYETYFNYVFSLCNQVSTRNLKWKVLSNVRQIEGAATQGFDFVTLHHYQLKE